MNFRCSYPKRLYSQKCHAYPTHNTTWNEENPTIFQYTTSKHAKRETLDELFLNRALVDFHPSNCKLFSARDDFEDNL